MRMTSRPIKLMFSCALGVLIFIAASLLADLAANSRISHQSRLISAIFDQESVGILEIATDRSNFNMLMSFAGAVATAYIDFELIPAGEASTFIAIFESLDQSIEIDGFEYISRDIKIFGLANTAQDYGAFLSRLAERDYFAEIQPISIIEYNGGIRFEVLCVSTFEPDDVINLRESLR